jgi:hypothetical protein
LSTIGIATSVEQQMGAPPLCTPHLAPQSNAETGAMNIL